MCVLIDGETASQSHEGFLGRLPPALAGRCGDHQRFWSIFYSATMAMSLMHRLGVSYGLMRNDPRGFYSRPAQSPLILT